jgi:hypothetical protein
MQAEETMRPSLYFREELAVHPRLRVEALRVGERGELY